VSWGSGNRPPPFKRGSALIPAIDSQGNPQEQEPVLETERLLLRRFTLDDASFILELVNDPAWIEHIGDRNVHSLEEARAYLRRGAMDMYERVGFGMWIMVLKSSGEVVGTCGLIRREALEDVDIGFAMLPQHRGKGLALEAARGVFEHATVALGMERLVAIVSAANQKSIRILESIGMRYEKTIRFPGDEEDVPLYAWNRLRQ
jgi:RimJ/RimL family protein N-acetyltransferase